MDDLKIREAAAIAAALLLARLAQLRFERDPDAPVLPFGRYLHARDAGLLLVPSIGTAERDLGEIGAAMTALGCDALVTRAGGRGVDNVRFQVGLHGEELFWTAPLRLWLGAGAPAHFTPDEPGDTTFALLRVGLRGCEVPPWDDEVDREAGLALGRDELARVLEGR